MQIRTNESIIAAQKIKKRVSYVISSLKLVVYALFYN